MPSELDKRKRKEEEEARQLSRSPGRFYARLSPAALRMLVETGAYPHLVFDVRPGPQEPLPSELRGALRLPAPRVAAALASREAWEEGGQFQGVPFPQQHHILVFVGDSQEQQLAAAAAAASQGFQRSMVLDGALPLFGLGAQAQPDLRFIGRDAVALLLGLGGAEAGGAAPRPPAALLIDVRRSDERVLYGAIRGSAAVPVDQLPAALALPPDQFAVAYSFPKPGPDDLVVFSCRTSTRSAWAAQLAKDAGLQRCLVFRGGVCGWRADPSVKPYRGYRLFDPPPEPEPFQVEPLSPELGLQELAQLGVAALAGHPLGGGAPHF
eukprot:scaffold21.g2128.t1